jgi:hypothetical protein
VIGLLERGLVNAKPQPYRRELDEGKVVSGEFVVARCDPTAMLDFVEETFDEVAGSIEVWTEADRLVAITFRRDVGPRALLDGEFSDPIGVVATASSIDPDFRRDRSLPAGRLSWASPAVSASRTGRSLVSTSA